MLSKEPSPAKTGFNPAKAEDYLIDQFTENVRRKELPSPAEIAGVLNISVYRTESYWDWFLYRLERINNEPIKKAVARLQRREARKRKKFPLRKAAREVETLFNREPLRNVLPMLGEFAKVMDVSRMDMGFNWESMVKILLRSSNPRVRDATEAWSPGGGYYRTDSSLDDIKFQEEIGEKPVGAERMPSAADDVELQEISLLLERAVSSLPEEEQELGRYILEVMQEGGDLRVICYELNVSMDDIARVSESLRSGPVIQELAKAWGIM